MRSLILSVLLSLLCLLPCNAQDSTPLPEVPLEPAPSAQAVPEAAPKLEPAPGVPRIKMGPNTPGPVIGPKVRVTPRQDIGESSIHGGQFRIFGGAKGQRDMLLRDAEATRRLVMSALKMEAPVKWPILVHIRTSGALRPGYPQVISSITQVPVENAFRFEINLLPLEGRVPGPLLQQELVRCILAETILREHGETDLSGVDQPPPDWLLHGLLELLEYQVLGRPSESFSAVFRLGRILTVEDIFAADPRHMDSVSLMVYRASCCGLMLMMLDQRGGDRSLQELLNLLPTMQNDPAEAIARVFPGLNTSGNSLGKWWSLQLAAASEPGSDEVMSPRDTENRLALALTLTIPAEAKTSDKKPATATASAKEPRGLKKLFAKTKPAKPAKEEAKPDPKPAAPAEVPIGQFTHAFSHPKRSDIFNRTNLALTQLALRAHPLYRPVIEDYRKLIAGLAEGKGSKEAAAKLETLAGLRNRVKGDLQQVEDQLDLFEATQLEGSSGEFEGYIRAADSAELAPTRRRDPLSRYMDSIEEEYKDQ